MKPIPIPLIAVFAASLTTFAKAGDGVLDLTQLANYANQTVPAYITKNNTTAGNAISDAGATLGRVLFYDKRLSRNDSISCSSCHDQAHAFSDAAVASTGVNGTTGRHSMRLINARFANEVRFFWDERATSLENQTTQPIRDHVEMGFSGTSGDPNFSTLTAKLAAFPDYRVLFAMTFGDAAVTESRIQRSLAQFVRSIQSFDSKFDIGRAQVANNGSIFPNFTPQETRGKTLFINPPAAPGQTQTGAGCAVCHAPPEFDIVPNSRNNGVITKIGGGTDLTNTRSPSLRDLIGPGGQPKGGFMHDGSFATIAQVINHYNSITGDNTNLDPRLRRPGGGVQNLNLSAEQMSDLAAFLNTLTGSAVYTDEKWSDPFNAQNELSLIVLPADAMEITHHENSTVTIACQAAAGLVYNLESSLDLKVWSHMEALTADASGRCEKILPVSGTRYFRFTYVPPAP